MSLTGAPELIVVAKTVARDLRRRQTEGERFFWKAVRNRKFLGKKFLRQHAIFVDYEGKETFFLADFYCADAKLVVEIDGRIHDYQKKRDALRTTIINDLGMSVIRFKNEDLEQNLERVLVELKKHL